MWKAMHVKYNEVVEDYMRVYEAEKATKNSVADEL